MTPEQLLRRKERQPERLYLIAEEDGRAVGLALVAPSDSPGRTFIGVRVLPEWRRRGIGSALYEQALAHARGLKPEWLSTMVSEAEPEAMAWAERRGFERYQQQVELLLQLHGDEQPPAPPAGVEIVEVTPELHEAAYALSRKPGRTCRSTSRSSCPRSRSGLRRTCQARSLLAAMENGEMVGSPG